jgi:hypothetical protein
MMATTEMDYLNKSSGALADDPNMKSLAYEDKVDPRKLQKADDSFDEDAPAAAPYDPVEENHKLCIEQARLELRRAENALREHRHYRDQMQGNAYAKTSTLADSALTSTLADSAFGGRQAGKSFGPGPHGPQAKIGR